MSYDGPWPPPPPPNPRLALQMAAAFSLGAFAGIPFAPARSWRGSREHCADCGEKVPPGWPGRRCQPCRAKETTP